MPLSSVIPARIETLLAEPRMRQALEFLRSDQKTVSRELKEMALVPGSPFKEHEARSPMYLEKLSGLGLRNCRMDREGNAYGFIPGDGGKILLEAHLDTVFEAWTPLEVTERDGRLYCPGIGDDTAGLALLLSVLRAVRHTGLKPWLSIMAGGSSGEEGEGDLRGLKAMLRDHLDLKACLSLEPGTLGGITKGGTGSKRYEFIFTGPGGHSWHAYGLPSPIHAMGRAIAKIAGVRVSAEPKVSYTVGLAEGGTSINSIAGRASCKLDMRSGDAAALDRLEKEMLTLVRQGLEEENSFRAASGKQVQLEIKPAGERPPGDQPENSPIVLAAISVFQALGIPPILEAPGSTNANAPISRGIPALALRTGGECGNVHALDEWFNPQDMYRGAQAALLLLFTLAGLRGVTEPLPLQ
ncbi:MAG: M20/M25/M40 family metallo-hydrolase [Desulfovibrionaceae bacterium]|nr:M20/M25/M40 family metallo-hydrolase [Desulfovibrionaceae bacterium]